MRCTSKDELLLSLTILHHIGLVQTLHIFKLAQVFRVALKTIVDIIQRVGLLLGPDDFGLGSS